MSADFFQGACPADIGFLIEARLEFDQHGHFFARFGGPRQSLRNGRIGAHPIERHLDRQHFGIFGRFFDEMSHSVERLIRMKDHDVAAPYRVP